MSALWAVASFGGFLFGGAMGIWQKIFRGGGIIATSVLSMIILKEKITNKQWLSLWMGILGIVFIGIGAMLV
ncbi:MAG: hypothetical protein IJ514_03415 [Clostridia bacterium]|nr:hypothetical protein [Clostridia bacterium]